MEYMQSQKNKYFDLAIVDPPYGIDAGSNKRAGTQTGKSLAKNKIYHSGDWNKDIPPKEYFEELKRVSKKSNYMGRKLLFRLPFEYSMYDCLGQR